MTLDAPNTNGTGPDHVSPNEPPQLRALHDLNTGEVHRKDTSYVGKQNEVRDMINATRDPNLHWPGLWYESDQGAEDYNDWDRGAPSFEVYRQGETEPISIFQFIEDRQQGRVYQVDRVAVVNYIKGDSGLRPGNVTLTDHVQKTEESTLGAHGRGLKIAITAACSGGLAERVTFQSYAPGIGTWYGEAKMVPDPVDDQLPPNMQLRYKRDTDMVVDKTTITYHQPSEEALEALVRLPEWFLPANQKYEHQRLAPTSSDTVPNLLTLYTSNDLAAGPHTHSVEDILHEITPLPLNQNIGREPPRVEILSREILPKIPHTIDFVYVDGLRVSVPGSTFSQIYSFWGLGGGNSGYNPQRSNDSLKLTGTIHQLLGVTLGHCDNPDVFHSLINDSMRDKPPTDSQVDAYLFNWELIRHEGTRAALAQAWERTADRLQVPREIPITENRDAADRAARENLPAVYVHSRLLVDGITRCHPGTEKVDAVFEKKDAKEKELHRADLIRLQREKEEAVAAEATRHARELAEALSKAGILKVAENTGEVVKISNPEHIGDSAEVAKLHLLYLMGMNSGRVSPTEHKGDLIFDMNANDFSSLPNNLDDMGAISPLVKNFLAAFGTDANIEIRIVKNGQGVFFRFDRNPTPDGLNNLTIHVMQGLTSMPDENLLRIIFSPVLTGNRYDAGVKTIEVFGNNVMNSASSLMNQDHQVDRDLYLLSEAYRLYPPALAAIRTQRLLAEAKAEAKRAIDEINAIRAKAGLPLFADPTAEKDTGTYINKQPKQVDPNLTPGFTHYSEKPRSKNQKRVQQEKSGPIIDDIATIDNVLRLIDPNSVPGLSTVSRKRRRQIVMDNRTAAQRALQKAAEAIQESLKRTVSPDFTLVSGATERVNGYLISHFNPAYTEIGTQDYRVFQPLPFVEANGQAHLRFNKPIQPGFNSLLCPPNYRPVAYFHGTTTPSLTFSGNEEHNVYAFTCNEQIPAGLTIYFERTDNTDRSLPDAREKEVIADFDGLNDHWKNLLNAINTTPGLSDKNKVDILIRAWTRAFDYNDSQETFDLYQESRAIPKKFATDTINYAAGNCGYCDRGFHALLSLAGIASRDAAYYLSDGTGNYSLSSCYHGINQPYIDGQWVYVEPQSGYIEPGFKLEDSPRECRQTFEQLLEAIPKGRSKSPRFIDGLPDVLPESMPSIHSLMDDLKEAVRENLPFTLPPKTQNTTEDDRNPIDRRKLLINTLKLTAVGGSALLIAETVAPAISNWIASMPVQAAQPIATAIQNTPTEVVTSPAVHNILSLPPEYVAAGILIGTGAFITGRFYERRRNRQKEKGAKNPVIQPSVQTLQAI